LTSGREVVVTFVEAVVLMRGCLTGRPNSAVAVFGQDFNEKLFCTFGYGGIDARDDFCQMHDFS